MSLKTMSSNKRYESVLFLIITNQEKEIKFRCINMFWTPVITKLYFDKDSKRLIDILTSIMLNCSSVLSILFYLFPPRLTVQNIMVLP